VLYYSSFLEPDAWYLKRKTYTNEQSFSSVKRKPGIKLENLLFERTGIIIIKQHFVTPQFKHQLTSRSSNSSLLCVKQAEAADKALLPCYNQLKSISFRNNQEGLDQRTIHNPPETLKINQLINYLSKLSYTVHLG